MHPGVKITNKIARQQWSHDFEHNIEPSSRHIMDKLMYHPDLTKTDYQFVLSLQRESSERAFYTQILTAVSSATYILLKFRRSGPVIN
jgi:hypothetical protein